MTDHTFPPLDGADVPWDDLRETDPDTLLGYGMRWWSEDGNLMLFPHDWYEHIPDDFEVTAIDGESLVWGDGPTSPDQRYGMLAYGIEVSDD